MTEDAVWLTQRQLAELYEVSVPTVNEHLANAYEDAKIAPERTVRNFRIVQQEGTCSVRRLIAQYCLEAIPAIDYRVRSTRGTESRQWATARLGEDVVFGTSRNRASNIGSNARAACPIGRAA